MFTLHQSTFQTTSNMSAFDSDDSRDEDFVLKESMLIQNSDSEFESFQNEDEEFSKRIYERYGGQVSFFVFKH